MDTVQEKEELREYLLEKRTSISEGAFRNKSEKITAVLQEKQIFKDAKTIHCYVSMNSRREVNTHQLLKKMFVANKDVVVPVTNFKDGTLTHIRLDSFDQLSENKWGVLEPGMGDEVAVEDIELVVVPMVGGDEQCNRIGYGKGFYDRFLSKVSCPTIGLCFEQNIVNHLPTEPFDIALDKIITETRIIG